MKQFKLNKKFQPMDCDPGDEYFPNGIFEFNITKLLEFIKANQGEFQTEWVDVNEVRVFPSHDLNESTIAKANLSEPILMAEISPGIFNVIDGHHRLEKAYRDGVNKVLAFKVAAEQHIKFLTSIKAYTKYIEYWNSKLAH